MNRAQRRHTARQLGVDRQQGCLLCGFARTLVGGQAGAFRDRWERPIDLFVNERLPVERALQLNGVATQLCEECAKFVVAWLEVRAQKHMEKHMTAGGRLTVATPGMLAQMLANGRLTAR